MDARCVDRPSAVVRADPSPLTAVAVGELVARGYDVHLSGELVSDLPPHPRLHPVDRPDHEASAELARSVRERGPLALVVCSPHHDVAEVCAFLELLRAPYPRAGVLVLRARYRTTPRRRRPPVVAGGGPQVIITTVDAGPRPLRAVRRGLDALTAR